MKNINFDVIKYLNNYPEIEYKKSGKNIGSGKYIGLRHCPFWGDPSFHLGISIEPPTHLNCWVCGGHSIEQFLFKIEKSWKKVNEILKQ